MILDSQEVFSAAQAVTATGDTASTNQLDTLSSADTGIGSDIRLIVKTNAGVTSGGAATVTPVLQTSADNATWVDALVGPAAPISGLGANTTIWNTSYPVGMRRYVRVAYRVGVATLTAGSFDAFNVLDAQAYQYAPTAFSVA